MAKSKLGDVLIKIIVLNIPDDNALARTMEVFIRRRGRLVVAKVVSCCVYKFNNNSS